MSVLTGPEIKRIVQRGMLSNVNGSPALPIIQIEPFDPALCGPNSFDVHLADELRIYSLVSNRIIHPRVFADAPEVIWGDVLDARRDNPTRVLSIGPSGVVLCPGVLYLGSTVERTATAGVVPYIDGRSSLGRLGLSIHVTAGRGDDGFGCGPSGLCPWTLEITVVHPLRIYPHTRIGQLTFHTIEGERAPYQGKYNDSTGVVPSRLWQDPDNQETK